MKIEWTAPAEADLDTLFDYIARDSAVYAERFVDRILESVGKLADQPKMGRAVPEADSEAIREIIYRKTYRVIYALAITASKSLRSFTADAIWRDRQ